MDLERLLFLQQSRDLLSAPENTTTTYDSNSGTSYVIFCPLWAHTHS